MPKSINSDLVDGGLCPTGTSSARNDGLSTQDDCDSREGYHPSSISARNDSYTQNSNDCDSGEGYLPFSSINSNLDRKNSRSHHPSFINSNLDRDSKGHYPSSINSNFDCKDSRSYHRSSSINSNNDNNSILPQYPPPVYDMSPIPLLRLFRRTPAATPAAAAVAAADPPATTIADLSEVVVANPPANQPAAVAHQPVAHQAGVTIHASRGCCNNVVHMEPTTLAVIITCAIGVLGPVIYFFARK
ncbi:uncharacterized protein LY89DRAFT_720506 [Mollisia scopiformis]|uniref:Uncharacterized protein n=1 Tax=Mollisia scopiformis TaxID=149040 RepID=A0A194X1Q2_MOLSC|nr:uncharacterized protein LY89DRAFT_720506 [Mollisia scopiformis]KUJ14131.1 hypothetical protein LY89DRAFT_720506 [Mollisia scopiformis]